MDTVNPLAAHYSHFRVAERLLLTGHSHQAWPDVGLAAQQQAWLDAAEHVDDKWQQAADRAQRLRSHWLRLLGDADGDMALGQNTHELVARLLSALPLAERPRLLTSSGEFHTIRRQLLRLREAGLEVEFVPANPADSLAARLARLVDGRTACVLVSSVRFDTAAIVPDLAQLARACSRHGTELLVDAYHHINAVPFNITDLGLDGAFITGGGYKYCQLGEGNAFLRVPPGRDLRPVLTGWYAEFDTLARGTAGDRVAYGAGAAAFAGATYDPVSHYRAVAVFDFHVNQGLTPERLRGVSRHQVGLLQQGIESLDLDPAVLAVVPLAEDRRAGFLALHAADAAGLTARLRRRGVHCDYRGSLLRLGPAPYLSDGQLTAAVAILGEESGVR
jgi:kynureninase